MTRKAVLEGRIVVKFDKIEAGTKGVEILEISCGSYRYGKSSPRCSHTSGICRPQRIFKGVC